MLTCWHPRTLRVNSARRARHRMVSSGAALRTSRRRLIGRLHQGFGHRQQRVQRVVGLLLQAPLRGHIPGDADAANDLALASRMGAARGVDQRLAPIARPEEVIDALLAGQDLALESTTMGCAPPVEALAL